jgi:nitroreductase
LGDNLSDLAGASGPSEPGAGLVRAGPSTASVRGRRVGDLQYPRGLPTCPLDLVCVREPVRPRGRRVCSGNMRPMDLDEALYTTRAMRRVKPDPVPPDAQARILDAAIRAPSGGNAQNWRFLLVDDRAVKKQLGPLYRASLDELWRTAYKERIAAAQASLEDTTSAQTLRVVRSAQYLADHFESVPLFMFAFAPNDRSGGSIFPAVWSAMLAARGQGIGSALTTVLGHYRASETLAVLGVPPDSGWVNVCCVSFGYPTGRWAVAKRTPAHEVAFRNQWGAPLGQEIAGPLWPSSVGK